MKKAIILFLVPVLILTLMLSGCGKSTAAQESSPAASAQPPSVNVTVELPDGSGTEADPYRISTAAQLEGIALEWGFYGFVLGYGLAPYGMAIPGLIYFFSGIWRKRRALAEEI